MSFDVTIIKDSFQSVVPIADKVVSQFYNFLWEDYPESKKLFANTNMPDQQKALIKNLVFIVDNLDNSQRLSAYLEGMGKRHVKYGTENEHFPWVKNSLLKTFAYFFQEKWSAELNSQWSMAIDAVAEMMIRGMQGAKKGSERVSSGLKIVGDENITDEVAVSHEGSQEEIGSSEIVLPDLLINKIRSDVRKEVQKKIRITVENEIKKQTQLCFDEELQKLSSCPDVWQWVRKVA